ncbi:hypothetical protein IJ750_01420 [bacterium]|nr:hypothetical protein [bacterium]
MLINVWIPSNKEFKKFEGECRKLYEISQAQICDDNSFEFIKNNTLFYLFENKNCLIGAIYYFLDKDGKLFLNGFANRKMHGLCVECLRMSLEWFKGSIYAEAQNRASALCLLKCGFRRIDGKLFCYINDKKRLNY